MNTHDTPRPQTATDIVTGLGARWSPDIDAYATGEIPACQITCALCGPSCSCMPIPAADGEQ